MDIKLTEQQVDMLLCMLENLLGSAYLSDDSRVIITETYGKIAEVRNTPIVAEMSATAYGNGGLSE